MSAPSENDADAIRNKRLARLQAFQQPRPSSPSSSDSSETPATTQSPVSAPSPALKPPSPQLPDKPVQQKRPAEDESKEQKGSKIAVRPTPPPPQPNGLTPEEAWEDRTLSSVFRAALRESPRATADKYVILDGLRKDLEAEAKEKGDEKPARLTTEVLDQLVLSLCSREGVVPMDMLIAGWRRANKILRDTPAGRLDDKKREVLNEAKRMCVNYALYCVTMPDMFEGRQPEVRLDLRLQADPSDDAGIPQDVLMEFVNRFGEEPELATKFEFAFRLMSVNLSLMTMTDNYKPYITALNRIAHVKPLAEIFVNLPEFLRDAEPQHLEKVMLLGPYFRISPLQEEVANHYFANARSRPPNVVQQAAEALRLSTNSLQDELAQIVTAFCKASENARNKVLDFFAKVLNANHRRAAMHVDHTKIASDGFMLNITGVLNRLCTPFMDATFSKIDRVDVDYFRRNPRLNITDETKLYADEASSKEFYSVTLEGKNNFITEIFFLASAAHHYGLGSAQARYDTLGRDVPELERHLERIEAERQRFVGSPQLALLDRDIARIKDRMEKARALKIALTALLMDPHSCSATLLFMRYQMVWLLRLVDPAHQYPTKIFKLPLPEPAETHFVHLPEYFIENVGNLLSFVSMYNPQLMIPTQLTELMVFAVTFLRSSSYILKANLKSRLVEIIYYGLHENRNGGPGYLAEIVHGNPFVLKYLMHALMTFYIEIERHYYEKFTVRYHISKIIQQLWTNQAYRDKLEGESDHNLDFFIRFVALLLNDVTYVLDHALTALTSIHTLHGELENPASPLSPEQKEEKEKALAKSEREASSYMQLANETVAMVNLFTATIPHSFVQPEIVDRLAGMLDYNLDCLVGHRMNSLRVRTPEKYNFNPRALLSEIASIYLNLSPHAAFISAIARDGRSYKPEIFDKAVSILTQRTLKSPAEIQGIKKMAEEVKKAKQEEEDVEMELGDVPDEFLDPIMATLMADPVILPSSRATIDRGTIKVHLLSDATDPFNRAPLRIEDVKPNVELKQQIDAWIAEKRKARHSVAAATDAVEAASDIPVPQDAPADPATAGAADPQDKMETD